MKPAEIDEMPPCDVWLCIEANEEERQERWEMTRAVCYNIGKFGNSDPKKFPKQITHFWPMPWDRESPKTNAQHILTEHAKMKALREELARKKQNNP